MQRGIREAGSRRCAMHGGLKGPDCYEIKLGLVTGALASDSALVFVRCEI